jgi:hypothetical protein
VLHEYQSSEPQRSSVLNGQEEQPAIRSARRSRRYPAPNAVLSGVSGAVRPGEGAHDVDPAALDAGRACWLWSAPSASGDSVLTNHRASCIRRAGGRRVHRNGGRVFVLFESPIENPNLATDLAAVLEPQGANQRLGETSNFDFYRSKNDTCSYPTGIKYGPYEPLNVSTGTIFSTCGRVFHKPQVPNMDHSYSCHTHPLSKRSVSQAQGVRT